MIYINLIQINVTIPRSSAKDAVPGLISFASSSTGWSQTMTVSRGVSNAVSWSFSLPRNWARIAPQAGEYYCTLMDGRGMVIEKFVARVGFGYVDTVTTEEDYIYNQYYGQITN